VFVNDMRTRDRGQVLVLAALFMVVLLVSAALAVDYGSWLSARRGFQSVVDASSLAAAGRLPAPGTTAPSPADRDAAAVEAMRYLNDHFSLGVDITTLSGAAIRNKTAPYVITAGGTEYCVWIWTPTPSASDKITGPANSCNMPGASLYSPANFAGQSRKVFVMVASPRSGYFGHVVGIHSEIISALAVAGGSHLNYAVIALKPRIGSPDTNLSMTISGSGSNLIVPEGDVGSNYSLRWGGTGSSVVFTAGGEQVVDLAEPGSIQGNGSVLNGTTQQLEDYPIEDPGYAAPPPPFCVGAVTTDCWTPWASTTPVTASYNGVYPACVSSSDRANHRLDLTSPSCTFPVTIYPGKYERILIPSGATVVMSPTCQAGDTVCRDPNGDGSTADTYAGVYYLTSTSSNSGLRMNGTPGSPTTLSGCGVLVILDPNETGGSRVQMNVSGNGNNLLINSPQISGCNMKSEPRNPTGTTNFVWYGLGASDFTNPVSVWVRPNQNGYSMTATNNGSNVITLGAGSTIWENGVIYAPQDNTIVSGGPAGSGVGQIVSWTITYTGNSNITESFQGPAKLRTRLYQ
jgi:hypothetical protein